MRSLLGLALPMLLSLWSAAGAAGLLGTAVRLEHTNFCRTYRCVVEGREEAGNGYTRTHLSLLPPDEVDRAFAWGVFELTRQGRVVAVRWQVTFQDDFFFPREAGMVAALSRAVLGVALPGSATQTLVNNALAGSPDPAKTSYRAGDRVAEAFVRGVGNAGEFNLTLTSTGERAGLRAVDPPRVELTAGEQQAVIERLLAALGTFHRVAPDCPADLYPSKTAVAIPLGDGLTEARVRSAVEGLGFEFMLGSYWREGAPASPLHVALHPNGREVCVGF